MRGFLALLLLLPGLAWSAPSQGTFDVYLYGLRAGVLTFAGEQHDGHYAASGQLESAGLVGALRRVRYDAQARGRVAGDRYMPQRYVEDADTGKRQSRAVMNYLGGAPQVTQYSPPRDPDDDDLDPATQGGTIDPMTAIWGLLRDVPREEVCRFSATMFDGKRRTRIALSPPRRAGDAITCAGEYRRLAGFSDEDLAERSRFPFRVTYRPAGAGLWRIVRIETATLLGTASLIRR